MHRRSMPLVAVMVLALLAIIAVLTGQPAAVRLPLAVLLTLVAPGYALSEALLPPRALGPAERMASALGLSLAVAALTGPVLNLTPWGLHASSWAFALAAVTIAGATVGLYRRHERTDMPAASFRSGLRRRDGMLFGLTAVVLGAGFAIALFGNFTQPTEPFTQLSFLSVDGGSALRLEIDSKEATTATYRLELDQGDITVREWSEISVAPGRQWQNTDPITILPHPSDGAVARLYRLDHPELVYRETSLAAVPRGTP